MIDLARTGQSVLEFLARVCCQLLSDPLIVRALERRRVHDVRNDRLVFPGQLLGQSIRTLISHDCGVHVRLLCPATTISQGVVNAFVARGAG
jgi:hypothetical protein